MTPAQAFRKITEYFSLDSEVESHDFIHNEILKGLRFKGTNLWILVFAIVVASVGLNVNSTAVIIGAMLISPLMGPINVMGYSVATYDFDLFRLALKNLAFAVGASLAASSIYFALSPLSTAHSELLARTSPTIYDVLIAFFGGVAGIIAITSKNKGNVIPGVAIATALMPPLCTAGYGIATGQFEFFFGAMYLFTINTVFIAIASIIVTQLLKLPIRTIVDDKQKKKVNRWITVVIAAVILPSIYFGYGLVQNEKFYEKATSYISNVSLYEGNYLLNSEINQNKREIILVYGGTELSDLQKRNIREKMHNFDIKNANIIIKQGLSFSNYSDKNEETLRLREELSHMLSEVKRRDVQLDSIAKNQQMGRVLLNEIRTIYPQLETCTYANSFKYQDSSETAMESALVLFTVDTTNFKAEDEQRVKDWMKSRVNLNSVKVFFEASNL
ncbi:DUF389 domain-containing protein [Brumimicrobium aurantiacum]|uniref:DUF389 domain-containing protein n=1 Tax=Brumimicrobium aurantiacum TaxID=1737063 RepID=A0A3E1EVY8_9FLAO|nr:DUF389 domain-containing protein [Brumimicrobium aurantiacum]RFC53724.1 DUF389 domain-containing protein [Brumimicrobium aurantiacum]